VNLGPRPRRLSIGTLFYKKVFPLLWIAFASAVAAITVWRLVTRAQEQSPFALMPLLVVAGIAFAWTRLVRSGLADEVFDGGDHLVVRVGATEERVALAEIEDVKESRVIKPPADRAGAEASGQAWTRDCVHPHWLHHRSIDEEPAVL
jgi:hypothetical protein